MTEDRDEHEGILDTRSLPTGAEMMAFVGHAGRVAVIAILGLALLGASHAVAQSKKELKKEHKKLGYGFSSEVLLAKKLWRSMLKNRLVGADRINVHAFEGKEPHGAIQQSYAASIVVNKRRARVLVKANHLGADLTEQDVYDDPNKYLKDYTVMFRHKSGYDPENNDWFWVKYSPDGTIDNGPTGVAIVGRVGKKTKIGCIGCHRVFGGEDLEVLTSE
ncbi:MAG: hypothetical protein ACR2OV_12635 [Hyphomicrobiaceae bacterium]